MSAFQSFTQHLILTERCLSPLSSSVDVPVSSPPKAWRNKDCLTPRADEDSEDICNQIEQRLDPGNELGETIKSSDSPKVSAMTFEENIKKSQRLRDWVKDCQIRHAERETFYDKNGKRVGKTTSKRPRYRLETKIHSKDCKTAVESGQRGEHRRKRSIGEDQTQEEARQQVLDLQARLRRLACHQKARPRERVVSSEEVDKKSGEADVKDFINDYDSDNTMTQMTSRRLRRDSLLFDGHFPDDSKDLGRE